LPLWWLLAVTVLGALIIGDGVASAWRERALERNGREVDGQVVGSWDGGDQVPVAYAAGGGDQVRALAWAAQPDQVSVGPARLVVDPNDAHRARLAEGPIDWGWVEPLTFFGPLIVALALWWWTRRRRWRLSVALAASTQPSYRMLAVARPSRFARRRWLLDLYGIDATVGSDPSCTVAVIGGSGPTMPHPVDVKGRPVPGGEVVAARTDRSRVWWPAGRALVVGGRSFPEPGTTTMPAPRRWWRWWMVALGVVVLLAYFASGESRDTIQQRSKLVTVTVARGRSEGVGPVVVTYAFDGAPRSTSVDLAGPQRRGASFAMRVDADHPERLWQPGTDEDLPGQQPVSDWFLAGGIVLVAVGIMVAHEPSESPGGRGLAAAHLP